MQYSPNDLKKLAQLHPDLRKVFMEVARISTMPFVLGEAGRSVAQQKKNIAAGVSWSMNSRHIIAPDGLVYALDVMPSGPNGKASYSWPLYYPFAKIVKQAAANVKVPVEWGGDWKTNKDGPHWQLPWKLYSGKGK